MRCEGYRRYGGAFSFGPIKWVQCENEAVVMLEVEQEKWETFPACMECWNEAISKPITMLSVRPIVGEGGTE